MKKPEDLTSAEVPEARQYGSHHELSVMAKEVAEPQQYWSKHKSSVMAKEVAEPRQYRSKHKSSVMTKEVAEPQQYWSKQAAFTLAEVLITLGIIGIVAAMTIPTLITKIGEKQDIAKLKEVASILNQATLQIANENGSLKHLCEDQDSACLRDFYLQHLKVSKVCNPEETEGNCWTENGVMKRLNGANGWDVNSAGVILNKGMFTVFSYPDSSCSSWIGSKYRNRCGTISVDVNGFSKPNKFGKDIFFFYILDDRIIPYGSIGTQTADGDYYRCDTGGDGEACAAKYLYNW